MGGKYINTWIWLINIIIAVTLFLVAQKFLFGGKSRWTLEVQDVPSVKLSSLWGLEDYEFSKKSKKLSRDPSDIEYRILKDFNLNQLELPPEPEPPKPKEVPPPAKPPTAEEALADLKQHLELKGIFAPFFAYATFKDQSVNFIWVTNFDYMPKRKDDSANLDNPDVQVYEELTNAFNLPVRCLEILPDKVKVKYTYRQKDFELELEYKLELSQEVPDELKKLAELQNSKSHRTGYDTHSDKSERDTTSNDAETSRYDKATNTWALGKSECETIKKNYDKMLNELSPRSYYNPKTRRTEGVILQNVPENSLARKYGFVRNDIILSINGHPVKSKSEAIRWAKAHPNQPAYTVEYMRRGRKYTRTFRPPRK